MTVLPPDPWKILGLEKSADKPEIRSAYKKLVLKCHPDKVQDPTLKAQKQDEFQKVQQAYELLLDDAERTKYEEQVKLAELRKQAATQSKNTPGSAASRTPTRQFFTYEVRTAESRFKSSSPNDIPRATTKVYPQYQAARSWDDDVSPRTKAVYEEERRAARRTASYEEPLRRDDERREDRRRKEKEEDRERDRDRREKEARDLRRAEKKRQEKEREKERDKERKRDADEKRRHKSPYVEPYEEEVYAVKVEKKKSSSSKKHDEPREKSSSRRERERDRALSPRADGHTKFDSQFEAAASYIERSRSKPSASRSQAFQEPAAYFTPPVAVPTPPPAEYVTEDVRRSSARPSTRRASNDLPIRSKEKPYTSRQRSSREGIDIIEAGSPRERPIPSFQSSHSAPPLVPESPPRPSRVNTAPKELYNRAPPGTPSFARTNTWAPGETSDRVRHAAYHYEDGPEEEPRSHRSSRRTHSPEPAPRYRVGGHKTATKLEPQYDYDDQSASRQYSGYGSRIVDSPRDSTSSRDYYPSSSPHFPKVKQAKAYTQDDVQYSNVQYSNVQYTSAPNYPESVF